MKSVYHHKNKNEQKRKYMSFTIVTTCILVNEISIHVLFYVIAHSEGLGNQANTSNTFFAYICKKLSCADLEGVGVGRGGGGGQGGYVPSFKKNQTFLNHNLKLQKIY